MSVEYTAKGQGYYRVYVDGEERSKHLTEREALENATNYLCEYRDNEQEIPGCIIKHDYEVDVTINAADITMQVGDGGVLEHIPDTDPIPEDALWVSEGASGGDGTYESPYTFAESVTNVSAGETIAFKNGTYTDNTYFFDSRDNTLPTGTSDNWIRIRAETEGSVIFDGAGTRHCVWLQGPSDSAYEQRYITFEGFHFKDSGAANSLYYTSYVKFLRCGFEQLPTGGANVYVRRSERNLFEECYAYGGGRYKFQCASSDILNTQYNIFRRCIARADAMEAGNNVGGFILYSCNDNFIQDCIVIDSDQDTNWNNQYNHGSFGIPTTDGASAGNIFTGCIALNSKLGLVAAGQNGGTGNTFDDCVFWDTDGSGAGRTDISYTRNGVDYNHLTVGNVPSGFTHTMRSEIGTNVLKSSIFYNCDTTTVISGWDDDYNNYYGNSGTLGNTGANDDTTTDPTAGSLEYLPRIESGSDLENAGETGDMGANIIYKTGVDGTLYGETGYNTTGTERLWPFPSEGLIRTKLKAYSYSNGYSVSGDRGFCADGTDLTTYIWEYLGNTIPANVADGTY